MPIHPIIIAVMEILAHRGYWKDPDEKNTMVAFERALGLGYGIETDVRDCNGALVIFHDPPVLGPQTIIWHQFLDLYQSIGQERGHYPTIAANIKCDGLAPLVWQAIPETLRPYFFFFDMSVPDALAYLRQGSIVYTRHSELETVPAYYQQAQGVWMDEFSQTWITEGDMQKHIRSGKTICLVSPELQKRPHREEWTAWRSWWRKWPDAELNKVLLCTDFPQQAEAFFNDR